MDSKPTGHPGTRSAATQYYNRLLPRGVARLDIAVAAVNRSIHLGKRFRWHLSAYSA